MLSLLADLSARKIHTIDSHTYPSFHQLFSCRIQEGIRLQMPGDWLFHKETVHYW